MMPELDIEKLADSVSNLVQVTVPERGTETELRKALHELSVAGINLTQKYIRLKAVESRVAINARNEKAKLAQQRAIHVANPTEAYLGCKNEKARDAYLDTVCADQITALDEAEVQQTQMRYLLDIVGEAMSRLKFLKETTAHQVKLLEIEVSLEPTE